MGWFEVKGSDRIAILEECIECFKNVSADSVGLTTARLIWRLNKTIDAQRPQPTLADGRTPDTENRMFRLFGYSHEGAVRLTIVLDRTLKRNANLVPERNHWCITLGIARNCGFTEDDMSNVVLDLLEDIMFVNPTHQLALLWTQRRGTASDELNADFSNLKGKSDAVFENLDARPNTIRYPLNVPRVAAAEEPYAHWMAHLLESPAPNNKIRFVPFALQ